MKNIDHNLFSHVVIPPPHANIEDLTPSDYQNKEVLLGKPTLDTTKVLITMGVKEVFKQVDRFDSELVMLRKQNELWRGYLHEVVGPH